MANTKTYTVTLRLPDGSRKYFRGKTRKEAEKKRDEARMKLGMGVDISCETTVAELAELWYRVYKESDADLHECSKVDIRNILDNQIIPNIGNMKVIDVKPIDVQNLMSAVSGYSKSVQKKVLQKTKAIFAIAVENGMIAKVPVSGQTKAGGAEPAEKKPLTKAQSDALLKAVEGTRAYLLVHLLLESGLRIGEALGLQWGDIDFSNGTLTTNRSIVYPRKGAGEINLDMKTKNAHRTIPLPWSVVAELRAARAKSNSVWVFSMSDGKFLSYSSFRSLWRIVDYRCAPKRKDNRRELVERSLDFTVHPHLLRHTRITRWFSDQHLDVKEVQYLAGHATAQITMDIYNHYVEEERFKGTAEKIQAVG